ncbi:MAG: SIR2 family protein [Candidatus Bathyarchaeia archaeon]
MSLRVDNGHSKSIIIFLGAGASAKFGCPATKAFMENFSKTLKDEERSFLSSLRQLHGVRDIEHIVEILDSLFEIDRLSTASSMHNFFERYKESVDFGKDSHPYPLQGTIEWHKIVRLARALEEKITAATFSNYQRKQGFFDDIKDYYGRFFSLMKTYMANKPEFEIFTTNYDHVIEDYCDQSGHALRYAVLEHTLEPQVTPTSSEKYTLTKLHGSLNWVWNKQTEKIEVITVQFPVPPNTILYRNNEFVLFGRKPNTENPYPYGDMFARFKNKLTQTDICIIVGFAFRHEKINTIINESLVANRSLQLFVISTAPTKAIRRLVPQAKLRGALSKEKRIVPIKGSFGISKTLELLETKLADS